MVLSSPCRSIARFRPTPGHARMVCDLAYCSVLNGIKPKRGQMTRRLYPAVLERGPKGTFGAWFPDFPGCVAAGRSHEETIERAEHALAKAVDMLFEHGRPLPEPSPIERIVLPKGCEFAAYFIVGVAPPDPSERVNVVPSEEPDCQGRQAGGRTRHESLQLLRVRGHHGAKPVPGLSRHGLGRRSKQGPQDRRAANESFADQETVPVNGWFCRVACPALLRTSSPAGADLEGPNTSVNACRSATSTSAMVTGNPRSTRLVTP